MITRRGFLQQGASTMALASSLGAGRLGGAPSEGAFKLNYILASSMYGRLPLDEVVGEARKTGAEWIDIWPEPHANHREQIEESGREQFARMLAEHRVQLGIYTCYRPGLMKSGEWMPVVKQLGGSMIIAGAGGPRGLAGDELKQELRKFGERIKPIIRLAGEHGLRIGIENHGGGLLASADSLPMLMEIIPDEHVGIAFAPYHLPQDARLLAGLIRRLGKRLLHFYAWEHGEGSSKAMPKVLEMKQMPGRGPLDFRPLIAALKEARYDGWTSIFMHPVPRGIPILPTAPEVTAAINHSREYLEYCAAAA